MASPKHPCISDLTSKRPSCTDITTTNPAIDLTISSFVSIQAGDLLEAPPPTPFARFLEAEGCIVLSHKRYESSEKLNPEDRDRQTDRMSCSQPVHPGARNTRSQDYFCLELDETCWLRHRERSHSFAQSISRASAGAGQVAGQSLPSRPRAGIPLYLPAAKENRGTSGGTMSFPSHPRCGPQTDQRSTCSPDWPLALAHLPVCARYPCASLTTWGYPTLRLW